MKLIILSVLCFAEVCLALSMSGCRKDKNNGTGSSYSSNIQRSFTCDDSAYQDADVHFLPDSITRNDHRNSYRWSFGDGATSTVATPIHFFTAPGAYLVNMVVNGELQAGVNKVVHITKYGGPYHMGTMGGLKNWNGTNSVNWGPVFPVTDTALNLEVIDSGRVRLKDITLNFSFVDPANALISYSDHYRSKLDYYYDLDSMYYSYYWQSSVGHGGQMLYLHTK